MDPLQGLFERFREEGLALIEKAVSEKWQETLRLDFKTLEKNQAPMTTSDEKNLAEALSGFANSDGGLIVWGISAKSDGHGGPDVAREKKPIKNLGLCLSDLHRLTAQLVSPAVIGVEHIPISAPQSADTGYAITLVPRSEGLPHMARARKQHTFYFRSGSSFLPMEPFMLADRYGRRPQPRLELASRVSASPGIRSGSVDIKVTVGIRNSGQGLALYPMLVICDPSPFDVSVWGLDGNRNTGLPMRTVANDGRRRVVFAGGVNDAVHPDTTLDVTILNHSYETTMATIPDFVLHYELHCNGFSHVGQLAVLLDGEFQKAKNPRGT